MRNAWIVAAAVALLGLSAQASPVAFVYPTTWSAAKITRFEAKQARVEAKSQVIIDRILTKYAQPAEDGWYTLTPKYFAKFNYITVRYAKYAPFQNFDILYSTDGTNYQDAMGLKIGKDIKPTFMRARSNDKQPVNIVQLGTPIPEPATLAVLATGVVGLIIRRRK